MHLLLHSIIYQVVIIPVYSLLIIITFIYLFFIIIYSSYLSTIKPFSISMSILSTQIHLSLYPIHNYLSNKIMHLSTLPSIILSYMLSYDFISNHSYFLSILITLSISITSIFFVTTHLSY
jgi:hypothetical protein